MLVMLGTIFSTGCGSSTNSSSSSTTSTTTTTVATSATTVAEGKSVTLTATVSPSAATGTVTFYTEGISIATATLKNGVASTTASSAGAPAGKYPVYAVYAGDTDNGGSTSGSVSVTVE